MLSTYRVVGVAEYAEGSLNDVGGGVAAAYVTAGIESSLASEVVPVLLGVAVMSTVELVQRARAGHLKVGPRDELTVLVPDLDLGLDVDADHHVQQPEQRLPG